ncbi:DUF3857 domain-containing protein [Aequorivita echinoideorum]|uniref:Transglutaminase-like domain-containing protein n=1 Tax=Aequorivita echinoideorum TaxID=1549647 RepID=A0ABS5S0F3_9FLAO|nr:DUF3857 domain-containing protein [Aequorivita echinoideorum]MBT0606654.1 transglutaminase-like domain-containing protein [Aequorivita echinoideorum]
MKNLLVISVLLLFANHTSIAQNFKFGKVSEEEVLQKEHPQDPSANASILYRETKTEFQYSQDTGFYMVTDIYERIKIYSKEGFDWANVTVDLHKSSNGGEDKIGGLRGNTYFMDSSGKMQEEKLRNDGIFEEKSSKYLTQTKFTLPALQEGCVIEYKYTITSPFIFNIDEYKFQETIPVDNVKLVFSSPEYFVYNTHQRGWVPYRVEKDGYERTISFNETTTSTSGFGRTGREMETRNVKFKEHINTVEIQNVPAMKEEAYAGNINNYATALQFELNYIDFPGSPIKTYSTTWDDVSDRIYSVDSFGDELRRSNYFEKDVDALLSGVTDSREKLVKIFEFAKNKMTWNNYNGYFTNVGVKDAYKKGSGNVADINLMLVAMLRHAGINASPVLVSTKNHGIPLFPSMNCFNYVIAMVEMNGGQMLLDATNKDGEIGILEPKILNWQGLAISKNGEPFFVPLRSVSPAVQSTMVNVDLSNNMNVKGSSQSRFTGNYALQYRSHFKNAQEDTQRKELEKEYINTELSNVKFGNLEKPYEPVSLQYDFEVLDAVEEVSGKYYFSPLLFMAATENPFKLEERNYPIDYSFPTKNRYIVSINIPEGYKVESIPESSAFSLGENTGSFKYAIAQTANKLQLTVELAINEAYIAAADYGNLKKFYELLIAKENEKVVLSKV